MNTLITTRSHNNAMTRAAGWSAFP